MRQHGACLCLRSVSTTGNGQPSLVRYEPQIYVLIRNMETDGLLNIKYAYLTGPS